MDAEPLATTRSLSSNPVTASVKLTEIANAPLTGSDDRVAIETPGAVPSDVIENRLAAVLGLADRSSAAPAAMSTATGPSEAGVMVAVYSAALTAWKALAEPLATVRSETSNPVTSSEKVTVTANAPDTGSAASEVIVTFGLTTSLTRSRVSFAPLGLAEVSG